MNATRRLLTLASVLMLMLCAATSDARGQQALTFPNQADRIAVVEKLPDGSWILNINGAEFRAISAAKVTELVEQKAELKACRELAVLKDDKLLLLEKKDAANEEQIKAQAEANKALTQIVAQLSNRAPRTKTEAALSFLEKVGGLAFQLFLATR